MKAKQLVLFYMAILGLSGVLTLGIFAAEHVIASSQIEESEKLYMQDEGISKLEKAPIDVVIEETKKGLKDDNQINTKYPFEKSLTSENIENLYFENSKKISQEINNSQKRTVKISGEQYQLIDNFTEEFLNTYISKELPDFNMYYDKSSRIREENCFLIESYIYDLATIKSNLVGSFEKELNITKVSPVAENVDEIIFYLVQKLHTDEGDENGGKWFVANIIKVEGEYKFISIWVEDPEYEMMQNQFKNDYLKENISLERDPLKKDLLKKYQERTEFVVSYDENEFSDKISNSLYTTRKTTLSYDRQAVAKAAKKYAYDYNKLFIEYTGAGGDCTNFVSQCIWQSPGWGFDRIGKDNNVKWACKKILNKNMFMKLYLG